MKKIILFLLTASMVTFNAGAQSKYGKHPKTTGKGWSKVFNDSLTNAIYTPGVWSISDGVITATKDDAIWSKKKYNNFVLDLEFKNAPGTNSGVIVHATETKEWIPHSVEIQIADDYSEEWSKAAPNWQCGAIFGHQPVTKRTVKPAGEWNHYTITCRGKKIWVVLNGELVNTCNMSLFTSAKTNPDGTEVPAWLPNPMATLALYGHIGFQGKHGGAPIYFRNIKIKEFN